MHVIFANARSNPFSEHSFYKTWNMMDKILQEFKKEVIAALGDDLVCLMHHGSRAKGEAHAESDYDVIVVVKRTGVRVLNRLRKIIQRHARLSTYLLSLLDLQTLPKAYLLQFTYARPVYGTISLSEPHPEDTEQYICHLRRNELDLVRHYLLHPHPVKKKAKHVYYGLKSTYIYLSFLAFSKSGKLPKTRKETIAHFEHMKPYRDGVRLLQLLDEWTECKDTVDSNPDRYLFMLEKFFRDVLP
jgi:predicted nucleotidyltransferase